MHDHACNLLSYLLAGAVISDDAPLRRCAAARDFLSSSWSKAIHNCHKSRIAAIPAKSALQYSSWCLSKYKNARHPTEENGI
jgi:hypothetical protein